MQILQTIQALRTARASLPPTAKVALVPTMGALHPGHLSLLAAARARADIVLATIFVNPLQFGPSEDLARYPRPFEADCALLEAAHADLVFAPAAEEIYPPGHITRIHLPGLEDRLDGASRPGHFSGVATIVARLFQLTAPHLACFGQKDAAQLALLRRMTLDLNLPVEIVACPIVRDPDGLALSSRNRFLSSAERAAAVILPRTLDHLHALILSGERDTLTLLAAGRSLLASTPAAALDYLALVDPDTLLPVPVALPGTLIALAASFGPTRLIDNLLAP